MSTSVPVCPSAGCADAAAAEQADALSAEFADAQTSDTSELLLEGIVRRHVESIEFRIASRVLAQHTNFPHRFGNLQRESVFIVSLHLS